MADSPESTENQDAAGAQDPAPGASTASVTATEAKAAPSEPPSESTPTAAVDSAAPGDAEAVPRAESQPPEAAEASEVVSTSNASPDSASPASAAGAPEAEDEAKGKRKRRRRRKKKKADVAPQAAEAGGESDKKGAHAPFIRYFEGAGAGRRHAFAVNETVAGRVTAVAHGAVVVDLFGKATAIVDEREPHEIEPLPETADSTDSASDPAVVTPAEAAQATTPGEATPAQSATEAATEVASAAATPGEATPAESITNATTETAASPPAEAAVPRSLDAGDATVVVTPTVSISDQPPPMPLEAAAHEDEAGSEEEVSEEQHALPPELPIPDPPALGSIFRGRIGAISESGHVAIVNRVIDRAVARERIAAAREAKRRVEGVVFGFNRGGFDVLVEGIRVFCPASGMSLGPVDDPNALIGHKFEFTVPAKKSGGQGVVVSRRSILEREARKARKARLSTLEAGQTVQGRVTQVREFGVFVDIGDGLEGLVHQSELAWGRGVRPADVAKPGDELEVQILRVGGDAPKASEDGKKKRERQTRVSLSRRALLPDPWEAQREVLEEGKPRKGKVVRTTDFGAFVQLAPGVEGLLHITELGKDLSHASQVLQDSQEVDVVIERVDRGQRRISLSRLSAAEVQAIADGKLDPSTRPKSLKPGSVVMVVIDKVEHHGIQVQVKGVLGRRGRGYLPNRELGSRSGGDKKKAMAVGTELEVKITGTDRDGGIRCSVKGKEIDEERRAVREYRQESAKQGFGTFGDLLRAKLPGAGQSD